MLLFIFFSCPEIDVSYYILYAKTMQNTTTLLSSFPNPNDDVF